MSNAFWVMIMLVITILMVGAKMGMAVDCNPEKLSPCLPFIIGNTTPAPDSECCNELHDQNDCLCSYVKNPIYGPILKLPGAKTVADACKVTIPDPGTCT